MRASSLPLLLLSTAAAAQDNGNITCADGLYMIVARGTNEDPGPGVMGTAVADVVADRIAGSEVVGLDYPASFGSPGYFESVADGGQAVKDAVEEYHAACPDGKMAVLGYSQGAQVSMNALCGGGEDLFQDEDAEALTPISATIINDSIVAIVLFGDPSHNPNSTYEEGTSTKDGIFARENITDCNAIGSLIVSYCDEGDVYCDRGEDEDVHGEYFDKYGDEVVDFVVAAYEDAVAESSSTSTPSGTATATVTTTVATGSETGSATESDSATGTETGAAEPTETDSGAAGMGVGVAWWVSLGAVAVWQVL